MDQKAWVTPQLHEVSLEPEDDLMAPGCWSLTNGSSNNVGGTSHQCHVLGSMCKAGSR